MNYDADYAQMNEDKDKAKRQSSRNIKNDTTGLELVPGNVNETRTNNVSIDHDESIA